VKIGECGGIELLLQAMKNSLKMSGCRKRYLGLYGIKCQ
jgi:hypothetical protein